MSENRFGEAKSFFQKAIKLEPEPKEKKIRIGMAYYEYYPNEKLEECKQLLSHQNQQGTQVEEKEKEIIEEQTVPEIVLIEPSTQGQQKVPYGRKNVVVKGSIHTKSKILWLKINQREVPCDTNGNFQSDIPLVIGINTMTIQARDKNGNQSDSVLTIERAKPAIKVSEMYQKSIAVIIGIDDYENCSGVKHAVTGAQNVLEKFKKLGFDDVSVLLDREASKERIYYELYYKLPSKSGPNDRVVIYFAGNSYEDGSSNDLKRKFIIPANAKTIPSPDDEISLAFIKGVFERMNAKHVLCIFDACFSGLDRGLFTSQPNNGIYDIESMANKRSLQFIMVNCAGKVSETENEGLLTSSFLKGLDGNADIDKDGFITGTELGMFIQSTSKPSQNSIFGRVEGSGEVFF